MDVKVSFQRKTKLILLHSLLRMNPSLQNSTKYYFGQSFNHYYLALMMKYKERLNKKSGSYSIPNFKRKITNLNYWN